MCSGQSTQNLNLVGNLGGDDRALKYEIPVNLPDDTNTTLSWSRQFRTLQRSAASQLSCSAHPLHFGWLRSTRLLTKSSTGAQPTLSAQAKQMSTAQAPEGELVSACNV